MGTSPSDASPDPESPALRVLVDTNVVLDLLLARDPWYTQAIPMWEARDAGRLFVYLSASSLTDIFYICRRQVGLDGARRAVEMCVAGFDILGLDRALIVEALALPGSDFEDNVQIASARAAGLDYIVTRDAEGFRQSPVPAVEPQEIVGRLTR